MRTILLVGALLCSIVCLRGAAGLFVRNVPAAGTPRLGVPELGAPELGAPLLDAPLSDAPILTPGGAGSPSFQCTAFMSTPPPTCRSMQTAFSPLARPEGPAASLPLARVPSPFSETGSGRLGTRRPPPSRDRFQRRAAPSRRVESLLLGVLLVVLLAIAVEPEAAARVLAAPFVRPGASAEVVVLLQYL
jgi:hypothetical protein